MRHNIQVQPPIIATHPTTGSNQIVLDIGNECKARFVRVVEAVDGRTRLRQECGIGKAVEAGNIQRGSEEDPRVRRQLGR